MVVDALQVVAGAAIAVAGGILTPFSGGLSLGLVALGGMMVVGGVNSGINHFSMATTGKGYNLIGNLTTTAGQWYNSSLGKSLGQDGVGGFVNGFVSGAGEMVSGMGQFSIYDIGTGIHTLATNPEAQQQMLNGFGNYLNQLRSGNAKVYGETAFNIVSLVVGGAEIKSAVSIAKASEVESVFSKIGVFTKALGKASLENGKSLLTLPGRAVDNIGNKLTDIRELLGGKDLNYAFAHAGEGRSVLNVVGKSADDLPRSGVRNNFSKVVGEVSEVTEFVPKKVVLGNGEIAYESKFGELVRSPEYLDEVGKIKWSEADGFVVDKAGNPITYDANLKAGQVIDRYGESGGRFTSPVNNGEVAAYDTRGLPYPESSMTYHQYEILSDLSPQNAKRTYQKSPQSIKDYMNI